MCEDFNSTFLTLLEEPRHEAFGRFNGPHDVSGAHTKNGRENAEILGLNVLYFFL